MNKNLIISLFVLGTVTLNMNAQKVKPTDSEATAMTKNLYRNLYKISQKHIIFGHQHATEYGHSWQNEPDRSDVKDITGSHPGVIGADFSGLTSKDTASVNLTINKLRGILKDTYKRGGVVTICWHSNNPVNDGSYYFDKNPINAVAEIIPGGKLHDKYKIYLDRIATVALTSVNDRGDCIPFLFRPFHEFDGDWFWWGKSQCTKEQFVELWRFTVDYLRNVKNVHSIIYTYSPDCKFASKEEYLERYPGDNYVDMFGLDDYWDFRPDGANNPSLALNKLQLVTRIAAEKNKLAAFTETGLEGVKQTDWYTKTLLPILKTKGLNLAYVLVWRNASEIEHHFYVPYSGHPAVADFRKFFMDKHVLLEKNLPKMYK